MLRPNKATCLCLIVSVLTSGALLLGQQINPPSSLQKPEDSGAIFRADTNVVDLHATVVDRNGHLVTNLTAEAFTVYGNGAVQQIRSFKREDVPVSMGLIIDNSGSMRSKRSKVEAAALAIVKDSNPDDEVFVVNFNDEA
jgi:Ca-activated chloride channel homolog